MSSQKLTKGPIFSTISLFAIPMLLGNVLQQLYNVVDTWVVGQYIGKEALASVGSVFTLMVFLTSVLLGLCMGSGVVLSQDYGNREYERMERRIGTAFLGIGFVAAVIAILAFLGMDALIRWMNIPEEVQGMTREYLQIVLLGIPAIFLYNFYGGYLKSVGNSVMPLLFLAISALMNIALDLIFVLYFHFGIAGAAWATVTAQYFSGVLALLYCSFKDSHIRAAAEKISFRGEDVKVLGSYSIFTCLQQSVMNLGILVVQGIVNSFGVTVMAAFSAGVKIDAFAYMPAQEYANAFSIFLAQNYGAGEAKRVRKGIRVAVLTSMSYCILVSLLLFFFAGNLMRIFVSASELEVIRVGVEYLHIEGIFYIGIGILLLWYGLYRALGQPQMSLLLTVISLGTRVLLASLSAASPIGVVGIWWSIPIGWALADLTGLVGMKRLLRQAKSL